MRRLNLLILISLVLSLTACPAANVSPTSNAQSVTVTSFEVAQKSLLAFGAALDATQKVVDVLYENGKITKADYNNFVPNYNKALASFKLAVTILNQAKAINADPTSYAAYTTALAMFMVDKSTIDNLLVAFGGAK